MDEYTKIKIAALAVLIGVTAFLLRLLGVLACNLHHVHTPLDANLFWCFIFSCLLWGGALMAFDEDL